MTKREVIEEGMRSVQYHIMPPRPITGEEKQELYDSIRWVYQEGRNHGIAMMRLTDSDRILYEKTIQSVLNLLYQFGSSDIHEYKTVKEALIILKSSKNGRKASIKARS